MRSRTVRHRTATASGPLSSTPVGTRQIVRNVVLALGAGFVAVEGPGPTINGWVAARGASDVVAVALGVVALGLLALVLNFWHERQRLQTELDRVGPIASSIPPGLPIGTPAPDFTIRDVDGATLALGGVPFAREARGADLRRTWMWALLEPCPRASALAGVACGEPHRRGDRYRSVSALRGEAGTDPSNAS